MHLMIEEGTLSARNYERVHIFHTKRFIATGGAGGARRPLLQLVSFFCDASGGGSGDGGGGGEGNSNSGDSVYGKKVQTARIFN